MTTEFLSYKKNNDGTRTVEILANGNLIIAYYYKGFVTFKPTDGRSRQYVNSLDIELENAVNSYISFVEGKKKRKNKKKKSTKKGGTKSGNKKGKN